jgi:hypothetical protein
MKKNTILLSILFVFSLINYSRAQQVIVTDDASYITPATGAMLDVKSTTMGFMPPRVALTASNVASPITSPSTGLLVYNTANTSLGTVHDVSPGYYYNAGDATTVNWVQVVNATGVGTDPTWDDIRVSLITRASGGTNPTFLQIQGTLYAYKFSGTAINNIYFEVQMPHAWAEGTTIYPHVHWASNGTATTNVTWGLDYEWQNIGGTFTGTSTPITADIAASGTEKLQQITNISGTGITESDKKISSILMCRLYRAGDTDPNNNDCFLLAFDIHYQVNSSGSRLIYTK